MIDEASLIQHRGVPSRWCSLFHSSGYRIQHRLLEHS